MKKNIEIISAILFAVCGIFASCTKENMPDDKGSRGEGDGNFSVTFEQEEAESKTAFNEDGTIWWSKGDGVLFAQLATVGGTKNTFKMAGKITLPKDSELLSSVTISSFNTPDAGTDAAYFSIYPYSAYASRTVAEGIVYPRITLPDVQTPSATCFDPAADILISNYMISQAKETSFKMTYKRTGALSKMTIKGLQGLSNINSIEFSAIKNSKDVLLAGSRLYDLVSGCFSTKRTSSCTDIYRILVNCQNLDTSSDFDVFMSYYPFELGEGDSFTIKAFTSNGEIFTRKVELGSGQDLKFLEGRKTNFNVNMSKADRGCSWFSLGKSSTANTIREVYWTAQKTDASVTVASIKDVAVTKAEFETIDDLDAYVEANGNVWGEKNITSINNGSMFNSVINNCNIDTEYAVILKVTDSDGRSAILTYTTRTDWCGVTLVSRSLGGVQLQYCVKNITTQSRAYRVIPTSTLEGITDLEDYYLNTLKPGTQPQATIDAINAKDGAAYTVPVTAYHTGSGTETLPMVAGTSYTVLVKLVNFRGESAFRSAEANAN